MSSSCRGGISSWIIAPWVVVLLGGCPGEPPRQSTIPQPTLTGTLYSRLGGIEALRVLIDEWMLEVASDERIQDLFAKADIARLKLRLVERICVLVQGPCMYQGSELFEVHGKMNLNDSHLRAFLEDLEPAMERAKIIGEPATQLHEAIRGLAIELAVQE